MQVYLRVYFFSLGLNISCKGLFSPLFFSLVLVTTFTRNLQISESKINHLVLVQ